MKTLTRVFLIFIAVIGVSCAPETKKDSSAKEEELPSEQIVGTWKLADVIFLSPADEAVRQAMQQRKQQVIMAGVQLSFDENQGVTEVAAGQSKSGTWQIKADTILVIQYANEPANPLWLEKIDSQQMNLIIGTPEDRSRYIFRKQQN